MSEELLRYMLDLAVIYPAAVLCYLPMGKRLHLPARRLALLVSLALTGITLVSSLICLLTRWPTSVMSLLVMAIALPVYRLTLSPALTTGKAAFCFATMTALEGACTMLTCLISAGAEIGNTSEHVVLASTALLGLGIAWLAVPFFLLLMRKPIVWLMEEFDQSRIWRIAWILPASFTAIYIVIQPKYPATILVNRVQPLSIMLVIASLLMMVVFLHLFQRIAQEITLNARLTEENHLLSMEAHRYQELRAHMEETRILRHDFRQHLRVIANLTEAGKAEELQNYLSQYDEELGGERICVCANAAVDAIAGYYQHSAAARGIPIDWKLDLPETLPLPETDICMLLGNLLENSLHASVALPPEKRSIRVMCQMLSPAMLGLIVENAYDGVLKREGGVFLSTRHGGAGFGLQSVQNTVRRYHGQLTIETQNQVFSVNVLLNL